MLVCIMNYDIHILSALSPHLPKIQDSARYKPLAISKNHLVWTLVDPDIHYQPDTEKWGIISDINM